MPDSAPDRSSSNMCGVGGRRPQATSPSTRPGAAAGVKLRPREASPLLLALGLRPQRLFMLGLGEREALLRSRHGGRDGVGRDREGVNSNTAAVRFTRSPRCRRLWQACGGPPY